jgi:hypothetical protein
VLQRLRRLVVRQSWRSVHSSRGLRRCVGAASTRDGNIRLNRGPHSGARHNLPRGPHSTSCVCNIHICPAPASLGQDRERTSAFERSLASYDGDGHWQSELCRRAGLRRMEISISEPADCCSAAGAKSPTSVAQPMLGEWSCQQRRGYDRSAEAAKQLRPMSYCELPAAYGDCRRRRDLLRQQAFEPGNQILAAVSPKETTAVTTLRSGGPRDCSNNAGLAHSANIRAS